jgi:hypothetical protein
MTTTTTTNPASTDPARAVPDANFLTFDICENQIPAGAGPREAARRRTGTGSGRWRNLAAGWRESALRAMRGGRRAAESRVIGA